jgi:hypothetical protein
MNATREQSEKQQFPRRCDLACERTLDCARQADSNRNMNGERNIEIFKPFGEAFELMKEILFRPFALKKWFVIGFAAWLSNIGSGGYNFNFRQTDWKNNPVLQNVRETLHQIPHSVLILCILVFIALVLALMIVFAWLRARGRFMLVDCIVKNRGAIAEPWREFRKEGNSYFLLSLLVAVIIGIIAVGTALPFLVPLLRSRARPHPPEVYVVCIIVLWVAILLLLVMAWALISHLMVAVMYRRRCRAGEAFRVAIALVSDYPGEITLYCLFWIALAIAAGMASCVVILATCCIALIPYIGTVIMLPIFVSLRGFGLRFIRQFGPDYDVWAGNVEPPPIAPPSPPPLQA